MEKRKKGHITGHFQQKRKFIPESEQLTLDKKEIIFGTRAIIEAIHSGKEIEKLLVQRGLNNDLTKQLLKLATDHSVPIAKVPIQKLNTVTRKNHQGAICFLSAVKYASLDHIVTSCFERGKAPLLIILDRITDVRNFGAIARTAECAGVDAIIVPSKGGAQITGDAMKTSAGALSFIPVCRESNIKNTIGYLRDSGITVLACTEKAGEYLYEKDMKQPLAILMGSEENGISAEYLKLSSESAKIPMKGKIASLNVSVATAIVIFEAIRQREIE